MFKRLFKKTTVLVLTLLFSFTFIFAKKSLTSLFKEKGIIFLDTISSGNEKAVLKIKIGNRELACSCYLPLRSERACAKFNKEFFFFKTHDHENIIKKKGFLALDGHYCIFTELADCDLANYHFHENTFLGFKEKIKILKDIISGISYMHTCGFVHCDLKPQNVVIFKNEGDIKAKLIDFTYSKEEGFYPRIEGTVEFMPPEYLCSYKKNLYPMVTKKFDIFSFGVLMHNIFYHKEIDVSFKNSLISNGYPKNILKLVLGDKLYQKYTISYIIYLNQGGRAVLNDKLVDSRINNLIKMCWNTDPKKRPTAEQVLEMLEEIEL